MSNIRKIDESRFRIFLRAIEANDFIISYKWRNNHDLMAGTLGVDRFVSMEAEKEWTLKAIEENKAGIAVRLAICTKAEGKHIGYIYLTDIDTHSRSSGIGEIIGEPEYQGKGYMFEARYLLFKYAFLSLGFNRISARILEDNYASLKSARNFGYTEEGILRQAVFKRGKFRNVYLFSMLKNEFLKQYDIEEEV